PARRGWHFRDRHRPLQRAMRRAAEAVARATGPRSGPSPGPGFRRTGQYFSHCRASAAMAQEGNMRSAMHAGNGWLVRHLALAVLACSMLPSYAQEAGSPQATDSTPESASDAPRAGVAAGDAVAVERVDPAMLPAEPAPLATRSLLLDIAEASQRAIAVGERGHVLLSESRHDWRQVEGVPTRATLTAVTTVGDHAWAVGHAQVILHSADGGLSWERQHVDAYDAEDFDDLANGAPLLDVLFLDQQHGLA